MPSGQVASHTQGKIHFSLITATKGSTQKRLIPGPDGRPVKDPNHDLGIYAGQVAPVEVDSLAAFAAAIAGLKSNQALTLGVTGSTAPQGLVTKAKRAALKNYRGDRIVARSLDYFSWPEGCFALLLDHDPEPGHPDLSADQLWARLCSIMPEFATAGRVVTVSSSSAIYDKATGECLKPASGHHTYIVVKGDVERFKTILKARCWLHGAAFFKLGNPNAQTGVEAVLERFIVDLAVFSPERLVYEAGADIDPSAPFEQRRPAPQVFDGDYIDLDGIPDLTKTEQAQSDANRTRALDAIRPQQVASVAAHVAKEQPDLTQAGAYAIARQRVRECDRGELLPDHRLYLADDRVITAGDIGPEHHEVKLRDPQEPQYRGGAINSIIYCDGPGRWMIHSQAHGGKNYRLAKGKAAPQRTGSSDNAPKPESGATRRSRLQWMAVATEYGIGLPPGSAGPEDDCTEAEALFLIDHIKASVQFIYEPGHVEPNRIIVNGQNGFNPDDLEALLKIDAPIAVTGNTGSGKTELAVALDKYMGDPSLLGVASTQNLSIGQANRLGTTSTASLEPVDWRRPSVPAESIYKIGSRTPELMIVDEPDALVPRLLEGSLGDAQDANLTTIKRLANGTPHQLWMNANQSPVTIDAIAHLSTKQPFKVEVQRDYGAAFHPEAVNVSIYTDDDEGNSGKYPWMSALFHAAKPGQNLLVLEPSAQMAKTIKRMAIKRGISCTLVDGTFTPIDQRRGFAFNPDQVCAKRQITIVTRLAETGADIKATPDAVFVRLSPNQTSEQGYQFLSRARKLLTGEIPHLHLHLPSLTFSGPEQVSVAWQLERIKAANAYKVEVLKTAANDNRAQLEEVQSQIDELEAEFTLLARYKAEEAAQRIFRSEYLLTRLGQVGFIVAPDKAITGNPDATDRWEPQVTKHKRQNERTKAACIARGHRLLSQYPEEYQEKIDDIREQGFILGCKRKKLDLSARFPLSPLENPDWILSQVIDNERAEPQTLVLGILLLTKDPVARAALQQHRGHLADSAIAVGNQYGPLTLIRKLAHRIDLAALDIAAVLSQAAMVQAVVNGTQGEFCKADAEVQDLAALLRANEDRLSLFCRLYLGQEMSWSEDSDTALVCKALNKLLGLPTARTTQKRVNGKPCHFYELGNTDAAIAVRVEKIVAKSHGMADPSEVRPQLLEAWDRHWGMAESAAAGWCQAAGATREATAEQDSSPCHTKNKALDHHPEFSVTPPPPDITPQDWKDLLEMVVMAKQAGADAMNDLAATLTPTVGTQTWEVLSHAAA